MIYELKPTDCQQVYETDCNTSDTPWSQRVWEETLNNHHCYGIKNETHQEVGFIVWRIVQQSADLDKIAINPAEQKKGYATQLLKHMFRQVRLQSITEIFLEVRQSNQVAIKLYERIGFKQQGVRKDYYPIVNSTSKEDAVLMHYLFLEEV